MTNNETALLTETELSPGGSGIKQRLSAFFGAHGYLLCAFIVPFLLHWAVYITMSTYPFGENSVLVLDLNGQYVYYFDALRSALRGDMSLIYSWQRAMGGEFMGLFAYYLASPLSFFVALFPQVHTTEFLLLLILTKTGICGATMAFYLKKTRPETKEMTAIAFSTLYALCSYNMVMGHNTMWVDALMWLPLIIYGEEELIKKGKFRTFVFFLSLTILSNFYIGYMVCIFVALYFFYYIIAVNDEDYNYTGEKFHFTRSFGRIALYSLIAVAISAVIILPTYYSLTFGKDEFSDPQFALSAKFELLDFIVKLFPGAYDTVRPEGLPWVYCGTAVLLLLPYYFISKKITLREKAGGIILIVAMVLSMITSGFDLIWHGFQFPNWLNYRYSFMLVFLMVVFACRAFNAVHEERSTAPIAVTAVALGVILLFIQKQNYEFVDDIFCILFSAVCILLVTLALFLVKKMGGKNASLIVMAAVICVEGYASGIHSRISLHNDVVYSNRTGYVNFLEKYTPSVEYILENDSSFFRFDKTTGKMINDNMSLGIRGLSNSTSTLNKETIRFLQRLGYDSVSHASNYKGGTGFTDSLLGLKYIITDSENNEYGDRTLFFKDDKHGQYVYQNHSALSLAFAANDSLYDFDINLTLSPFETMNDLITAILGEDEQVQLYKKIDAKMLLDNAWLSYTGPVYETLTDKNGNPVSMEYKYKFYKPDDEQTPAYLHYTLDLPVDSAQVFFYVPTNYPREIEWKLYKGGASSSSKSGYHLGGGSTCIQSLGVLDKNTENKVSMQLKADIFYICTEDAIFYYLDTEVYDQVMARLQQGNLVIEKWDDTHFKGSIDLPANYETVMTTIPYDSCWRVKVDGESVPIKKACNAVIAFDVEPGTHTVELTYLPEHLIIGGCISIIGIALFLLFIYLDREYFEPRRERMRKEYLKRLEEEAEEARRKLEEAARLAAEAEAANNPAMNSESSEAKEGEEAPESKEGTEGEEKAEANEGEEAKEE